ncbi:hypothetical protein [Pseudomonas sp. Colony2]|uniref:hypothetical protein n=1 Tax=Pseudomonas sp. Colony2 TaxID=2861799 RepID=UPI002151A8C1|nr:hypothetical protein [Pseudomonas sp. Colony2]
MAETSPAPPISDTPSAVDLSTHRSARGKHSPYTTAHSPTDICTARCQSWLLNGAQIASISRHITTTRNMFPRCWTDNVIGNLYFLVVGVERFTHTLSIAA